MILITGQGKKMCNERKRSQEKRFLFECILESIQNLNLRLGIKNKGFWQTICKKICIIFDQYA